MDKEYVNFTTKENRGNVNVKVFIVDFDSVQNSDLFIINLAKILIVNQFLKPQNEKS